MMNKLSYASWFLVIGTIFSCAIGIIDNDDFTIVWFVAAVIMMIGAIFSIKTDTMKRQRFIVDMDDANNELDYYHLIFEDGAIVDNLSHYNRQVMVMEQIGGKNDLVDIYDFIAESSRSVYIMVINDEDIKEMFTDSIVFWSDDGDRLSYLYNAREKTVINFYK